MTNPTKAEWLVFPDLAARQRDLLLSLRARPEPGADCRRLRGGPAVNRVLIAVIAGYRLIPSRVRRTWSGGCSTSHLALGALQSGHVTGLAAWAMVARMAIPRAGNQWDGTPARAGLDKFPPKPPLIWLPPAPGSRGQ